MKFIITENKIKNVVFKYLDTILDSLEYEGNYYFPYKGTNELVIKCLDERGDGKLRVIISSHIIDDIKLMFTITDRESSKYIWEWIEHKTNVAVTEIQRTPYIQELPFFVRR